MNSRRAALLLIGLGVAVWTAYAQTPLPNGLIRSGGVIMMPPIPDGSTDSGFNVGRGMGGSREYPIIL